MKTTEIVKGDIFIIPNPGFIPENVMKDCYNLPFVADLQNQFRSLQIRNKLCEDANFMKEKFVQVWYVTPGNDDSNWVDHGIDGYPELYKCRPKNMYLPKSLFNGKKEGDVITFDLLVQFDPMYSDSEFNEILNQYKKKEIEEDDFYELVRPIYKRYFLRERDEYFCLVKTVKVSLTLAQTKYRYKSFGKFEEVLARV